MIKKEKFRSYTTDDEKKEGDIIIPLKMNLEEQRQLEEDKKLILQVKSSTAIKQLMTIGAKVLRDEKINLINQTILNNYRKNKRNNIIDFD